MILTRPPARSREGREPSWIEPAPRRTAGPEPATIAYRLSRFTEFLPPMLWPAVALVALGVLRRLVFGPRRPLLSDQWWLLGFAATMAVTYKLGYSLGVVDIRFLPFVHGIR